MIRAEGIRGHGTSQILSLLRNEGFVDTIVYPQDEVQPFTAAQEFFRTEGVCVALESSYAVKAAIDESDVLEKAEVKAAEALERLGIREKPVWPWV